MSMANRARETRFVPMQARVATTRSFSARCVEITFEATGSSSCRKRRFWRWYVSRGCATRNDSPYSELGMRTMMYDERFFAPMREELHGWGCGR